MSNPDLAHLELLAEIDTLLGRLRRWADGAPDWQPADTCRALVGRLAQRAEALRVRLDAPLVVATLGGTGTGKSALVNALLGAEVVRTGKQRPTTARPTLICRPDITPQMLGIDPHGVEVLQRDLPALGGLALIDCPDPDTTEQAAGNEVAVGDASHKGGSHKGVAQSNLSRLRAILPLCDVLLVTTTQQKYRSARVADELAAAAAGAQLVFVQTHADVDQDVRDDWRNVLRPKYVPTHVFLVDSPGALADAQQGVGPRGEFARLVDLLTRELAGTAAARIRRTNFLDLVDELLAALRKWIEREIPAVRELQAAVDQQRAHLAAELAQQMRGELLANRRSWENRLLGRVAARWGFSPFALVLRVYQGLGGLLSSTFLFRARTPAQMALWGAVGGARIWQRRRREKQADRGVQRAVARCWDQTELRSASIVLAGYAAEAGLPRSGAELKTVTAEADEAGTGFVDAVADELESLIARLAERHAGPLTRFRYELLLLAVLGWMLYRLGRNYFYDSWLGGEELFGLDFYVQSALWMLLWCLLLLWAFTGRLRRGLRRQLDQLADGWNDAAAVAGVFAQLEEDCRGVEQFRHDLETLQQHVATLRRQLATDEQLEE